MSIEKPTEPIVYNREYAVSLAEKYGEIHSVNSALMMKVMDCETGGRYEDPSVQSGHDYKGARERSYGYAQIHLDSWPEITIEQASDPEFAVNFMAEKMSEGKGYLWTCYRKLLTSP